MLKKYFKLKDSNSCNINYIVYSPEKKMIICHYYYFYTVSEKEVIK